MSKIGEEVDKGDGTTRPPSSAFSDSSIDGAMSVFLEDAILAAGESPENLLKKFPGRQISWMLASDYAEEGQQITPEPQDEFFPGHANVRDSQGKRSARTKTRLAMKSKWYESE